SRRSTFRHHAPTRVYPRASVAARASGLRASQLPAFFRIEQIEERLDVFSPAEPDRLFLRFEPRRVAPPAPPHKRIPESDLLLPRLPPFAQRPPQTLQVRTALQHPRPQRRIPHPEESAAPRIERQ